MPSAIDLKNDTACQTVTPQEGLLLALHQGALCSPPWQDFIDLLREELGALATALVLYPTTVSAIEAHVISSDPECDIDWDVVNRRYIEEYLDLDPISCVKTNPGELNTLDEHTDSTYFQEFLQPLGIEYALRIGFSASGRKCWISACRSSAQGNFSDASIRLLKTLNPHLEVSLATYAAVMLSNSERLLYNTALQNMSFGSLVLDVNGRILSCNSIADDLIQRYSEIRVEHQELIIQHTPFRESLLGTLQLITEGAPTEETLEPKVIRVDCQSGGPIGLLVKPVAHNRYFSGSAAPAVVIYMSDLSTLKLTNSGDVFDNQGMISALFGLTLSEAKLALLLADGMTLAHAGRSLNVAEKTARNHLAHIFEKTGVSRQVDLIRLIYRSVAVLGR
jgi:DNA-binding CsgD family transcriptional regulator